MQRPDLDDSVCIRSWESLIGWVNLVGFLPLFRNKIEGFSAEECICPFDWLSDDAAWDPWEWRQVIARSGRVGLQGWLHLSHQLLAPPVKDKPVAVHTALPAVRFPMACSWSIRRAD